MDNSPLSKASDVLEAYRRRDTALSLFGYSNLMCSGLCTKNDSLRLKLRTASVKIYEARTIFRCLDDCAMLRYTLLYGLGQQEKNLVIRVFTVAGNLMSHVYLITEKLAFMADNKLINLNSGALWLVAIINWLFSIVASIICHIMRLIDLANAQKQSKENISLFADVCWLINCVHWLPVKFLWSGKLSEFRSGLLGILATVLGILAKL